MLEAAEEASGFIAGTDAGTLEEDRMRTLAIVRCLEIVGEAASQVTNEARIELPSIPWSAIVGMRNRLIHAYFSIDLDVLWNTVTRDLPPMCRVLREALRDD
jgi:uncharacterized protein with HEPN domain